MTENLKYDREYYESYEMLQDDGDDGDVSNQNAKLVKTRKPHTCQDCQKEYPAGTTMISLSSINRGTGRQGFHMCIDCANEILKYQDIGDDTEDDTEDNQDNR